MAEILLTRWLPAPPERCFTLSLGVDARLASPAGPSGRLVDGVVLTRYVARLPQQRNNWLAGALAAEERTGR